MASGKIASWAFGESFVNEERLFEDSTVIARARERGSATGSEPVLAGAAAHVRSLVALQGARSILDVSTGSGVLALYIASVLGEGAVLTTIDPDPQRSHDARASFVDLGFSSTRVRTINGRASTVLPRFTPGAYDMVVLYAQHPEIESHVELARPLLRTGGALVIMNALFHDRVADSMLQDDDTRRIRTVIAALQADPELVTSLSPAGDGVLTAILR